MSVVGTSGNPKGKSYLRSVLSARVPIGIDHARTRSNKNLNREYIVTLMCGRRDLNSHLQIGKSGRLPDCPTAALLRYTALKLINVSLIMV